MVRKFNPLSKKRWLTRLISVFILTCFVVAMGVAQENAASVVSGQIVDDAGTPLQGAIVSVVGNSSLTVATEKSGRFTIKARIGDSLSITHVGYVTRTIVVNTFQLAVISLDADPKSMESVVVIGYGTTRKKDLTGSVAQVSMSDVGKAPVSQIGDALAGRVAGVNVSATDGQPGSDINIVIRGANSLTQSNSPLYVIDGFPIEDPSPGSLNPSDIESITILKDASSTAIYGARAANGVVLIETKRGKVGKPQVSLSSSIGFQDDNQRMEVMNPYEFVKYLYEFSPTSTANTYLANGETLESYKDSAGINWQDQVLRTGSMQIHNLSIRGGNGGTRYAFSGSLLDQKGIVINSGFKRYQARITLDQNLGSKFKFGFTANYSNAVNYGERIADAQSGSISSSTWFRVWGYRPVAGNGANLIDADADPEGADSDGSRLNPRISLENNGIRRVNDNITANAFLSYDITPKLRLKVLGALDNRKNTDKAFYNSQTPQGSPYSSNNIRGVNGNINFQNRLVWTNENTLTYQETFGDKHDFTAMVGNTLQEARSEAFGFASEQLPNEILGIYGLDQGIPYNPEAVESGNSLVSFFSRLNYAYDSRYVLTLSYRGDASSKFADPWGFFPSGGLAWNVHNEKFMRSLVAISQLKLRSTYGISGNNRIGDFDRLAILNLSTNGYSFNNGQPISSVVPARIANSALRWEVTRQLDFGIDLGLFRNRLELTVDYYRKKTADLLLNADLSPSLGFSSAVKNIGSLQNEGLEIAINSTNIATKDFQWTSSFNISFNRNKILALNDGQNSITNRVSNFESQFSAPLYVSEVGRSAGMFYGLIYEGLYQLGDFDNPAPGVYILKKNLPSNGTPRQDIRPGDIKYRDLNGDGTVDNYDLTIIGRGLPVHVGGFTNNFTYRNFSLGIFLQWSYGNDIYNANRIPLEGNSNGRQNLNQFASYIDRWSPDNQDAKNFRVGGGGPTGRHSSRVLEDGSYLRFKTISFSYSLPDQLLKKLRISSLVFNVAAQNLITFTRYSGMDPEVSVRNSILTPGFDYSAYPMARTVVFGISAGF